MIAGSPHGYLGQGQFQEWYVDSDSPFGRSNRNFKIQKWVKISHFKESPLSVIHVYWKAGISDGGIVGMQAQYWDGYNQGY